MARRYDCHEQARESYDRLKSANMEQIFQSGLHEFLQEFIAGNTSLSQSIAKNYNFPVTMRLAVRHETHYDYDTPLAYSAQRLHLWPADFASQKTISWSITAPGFDRALGYTDGFGNRVHMITFGNLEGPVAIIAEGVVEVTDTAGLVRGLNCPAPEAVFLRQTKPTTANAAIRALAEKQFAGRPVLDGLHALMAEIHAQGRL